MPPTFAALVERRAAHEPVAYITGRREFWSLDLAVTPATLIPRPDTETLIDLAVRHLPPDAAPAVLDLGTGSGALLLAALSQWPAAWGVGIDLSAAAVAVARANAHRLGLADRAAFVVGNWATAIAGRFDLILVNAPYVATGEPLPREVAEFEPTSALRAGPDGGDAHRAIVPTLGALLAPGGLALIEIGASQSDLILAVANVAELDAKLWPDLAGQPRVAVLAGRN